MNRLSIESKPDQGAARFIKKTTFGLTDSLTKFTSSVGKGLSSATFDAEYQERRRLGQRRNKPRHAFYEFTSAPGALLDSLGRAVQGVIVGSYTFHSFFILMNHKAQP